MFVRRNSLLAQLVCGKLQLYQIKLLQRSVQLNSYSVNKASTYFSSRVRCFCQFTPQTINCNSSANMRGIICSSILHNLLQFISQLYIFTSTPFEGQENMSRLIANLAVRRRAESRTKMVQSHTWRTGCNTSRTIKWFQEMVNVRTTTNMILIRWKHLQLQYPKLSEIHKVQILGWLRQLRKIAMPS